MHTSLRNTGARPNMRNNHTWTHAKPDSHEQDSWLHNVGSRLVARLQHAAVRSVEYSRPNMPAAALVAIVAFPLYYLIWGFVFPQPYENLPLRLLGMVLALPLLFVNHLPAILDRYLPFYWHFVLCYSMPFFFTFMMLKNDMSLVWSLSSIAIFALLVLLIIDWLMLLFIVSIGYGLAWLCFSLGGNHLEAGLSSYLAQLSIYLFVLITGSVLNYTSELVNQKKMEAIAGASNTIAHELRTPLLSIRSGISGIDRYLPSLLEGYALARNHGLPVRAIRTAHHRELKLVLERIENEAEYSNMVIDLLLFNASQTRIDIRQFTRTSMADCIEAALDRYPFKSDQERAIVYWRQGQDFNFRGSSVLMVHVLFNLLKNALQSIAAADKGDIAIWISHTEHSNRLHFRDTGQGIEADTLTHVFEHFYTTMLPGHGSGIGLAFCRMVMTSFGGSIDCTSDPGQFTEFVLAFPRV